MLRCSHSDKAVPGLKCNPKEHDRRHHYCSRLLHTCLASEHVDDELAHRLKDIELRLQHKYCDPILCHKQHTAVPEEDSWGSVLTVVTAIVLLCVLIYYIVAWLNHVPSSGSSDLRRRANKKGKAHWLLGWFNPKKKAY
eukprot:TRINITY_DN3981_c0_g1_i1.p1 TRINITY_DN3981_c0_g1~~TRINITY_DN3981_c0_g1_i1.p1  ORF type:complete len:139 (-),score=41.01 TRINITY_DN3981_c0_g1_i1:10-426(-)